MALVNLSKQEYSKIQYEKVINTSFTQLVSSSAEVTPTTTISVNEFFDYYQTLFFDIPKFGETNSHEYLVKTSQEYIKLSTTDDTVQALVEEITQLRQENLELNQFLIELQTTDTGING